MQLNINKNLEDLKENPNLNHIIKVTTNIMDALCKTSDNFTWEPPMILSDQNIFILRLKEC